jgi:hypothetical protein
MVEDGGPLAGTERHRGRLAFGICFIEILVPARYKREKE